MSEVSRRIVFNEKLYHRLIKFYSPCSPAEWVDLLEQFAKENKPYSWGAVLTLLIRHEFPAYLHRATQNQILPKANKQLLGDLIMRAVIGAAKALCNMTPELQQEAVKSITYSPAYMVLYLEDCSMTTVAKRHVDGDLIIEHHPGSLQFGFSVSDRLLMLFFPKIQEKEA